MSLKFGIYLVEQRIISPEQFCGLIKIQQQATASLATISIRHNIMTIKQVAKVLHDIENNPAISFVESAIEQKFIDQLDAERLLYEQQSSCPNLRTLLVECGLLTEHQTRVLFQHFEKQAAKGLLSDLSPGFNPTGDRIHESDRSTEIPQPEKPEVEFVPPQPKFSRRPLVVKPNAPTPSLPQ